MSAYQTKVCPRCGEELFSDMRVCYGCLYEFPPERSGAGTEENEGLAKGGEDPASQDSGLPGLREDEPFRWDAGLPPAEPGWEDGTLDLSASSGGASGVGTQPGVGTNSTSDSISSRHKVLCWVRTPSLDVRLPIPEEGLVVGRDPTSDVVLHSRAVSRSHVRILPAKVGEQGMRVLDLGATNPALFSGREVRGEVLVPLGWTVSVCGAFVTPVLAEG